MASFRPRDGGVVTAEKSTLPDWGAVYVRAVFEHYASGVASGVWLTKKESKRLRKALKKAEKA